jgi:hypothetical protein
MAVKLLLILTKEKGIFHINIFGDAQLAISCINGQQTLHTYTLQPLLEDIKRLISFFAHTSFPMSTGSEIKKWTASQRLAWTWTKAAGRSGKKARLAPLNIFTTIDLCPINLLTRDIKILDIF